ncbi:MAG: hypothetical protein GY759_04890 [Chloroflexi bacterium]|nr:hypothetical protein [Chloroflexota bacterium]
MSEFSAKVIDLLNNEGVVHRQLAHEEAVYTVAAAGRERGRGGATFASIAE